MAIAVGIVGESDVEPIAELDELRHRMRRRAVHPDPSVTIERHETESGIDGVVHDLDVEPVGLGAPALTAISMPKC